MVVGRSPKMGRSCGYEPAEIRMIRYDRIWYVHLFPKYWFVTMLNQQNMDLRATRKRGHFENISPIFRGDSPNHGFMDQQIHGISTNQTKLVSATNGPAPL
jgi:hypothetical protein